MNAAGALKLLVSMIGSLPAHMVGGEASERLLGLLFHRC
jgi:hypothetical protein